MIFWVEVNRNIGMGHLMECLALAEEAEARGAGRTVHVPSGVPSQGRGPDGAQSDT